jgi:hypothetical protein
VVHRVVEEGSRLVAEISGELRETDVFGADLLLRRRIRLPMGENTVLIRDEVVNQGFAPTPLLILYHINVGYPVVADDARLVGPPAEIVGRDEAPGRGRRPRLVRSPLDGARSTSSSIACATPMP